jgi:hypothetical protein
MGHSVQRGQSKCRGSTAESNKRLSSSTNSQTHLGTPQVPNSMGSDVKGAGN